MKRSVVALVLAVLIGMPSPLLWAQSWNRLDVGDYVRIQTTPPSTREGGGSIVFVGEPGRAVALAKEGKKITGKLLVGDEESLMLEVEGFDAPVRISLHSVTDISVRRRKSRVGTAALVGLVGGAALGAAAGEDCTGDEFICFDRGASALFLGVGGLGLGALIGVAFLRGRWEELDPDRLQVAITPAAGGGVGAQVSFSF